MPDQSTGCKSYAMRFPIDREGGLEAPEASMESPWSAKCDKLPPMEVSLDPFVRACPVPPRRPHQKSTIPPIRTDPVGRAMLSAKVSVL